MSSPIIYLDNAATTKVDQDVIETMIPYMSELYANASSSHLLGTMVNKEVKTAREKVGKLFNVEARDITFTSGATEAINTILKGAATFRNGGRNQIITCETEHAATLETCKYLETMGVEIIYLPVNAYGIIDLEQLKAHISDRTLLISIMLANNETGVLQDIKNITKIAHEHGALMMSDATQAVGKLAIDVEDLDIDFLVFSAHKFHGPKGIGGFYSKSSSKNFPPLLHGGGQEKGKRSGTLNVANIVGLGKCCENAFSQIKKNEESITKLRDMLEDEILRAIPESYINGEKTKRLCNITNICFPKIDADIFIKMLNNVCVSNGSACHSSVIEASHVLKAMGLNDSDAFGSLRFSLSKYTTEEEIHKAIEKVKQVYSLLNN